MKNFEQTVVSQYSNSPTLMHLIESMNEAIDPSADIENFYEWIWNVDTAQGFGLDIWGRIVKISRNLKIPTAESYFGFNDGIGSYKGFNQAPFYSGIHPATQTYALTDDDYRSLIMAKALFNITAANIPSINKLLQYIFPGTRSYVTSQGNMMIQYVFEYKLTSLQFAIVTQAGILPVPAGTNVTMLTTVLPVFGFAGAGRSAVGFGQRPFISPGAINAIV